MALTKHLPSAETPRMKKRSDPTALVKKALKAMNTKKVDYPSFRIGDTVRVHVKVTEGEKSRVQVYEGIVIRIKRGGASSSFTVRKISYGIGVERVFPYHSPVVEKVAIVSQGEVRRAKLYYLRALSGRASRIKSELVFDTGESTSSGSQNSEPVRAAANQG